MEKEQITIDGRTYKLVALHGRCGKCGLYVSARAVISPLEIELPNEAKEWPHAHLTMLCWRCGCLINLIDVSKPSLRRRNKQWSNKTL
jgi:hypothetical protein